MTTLELQSPLFFKKNTSNKIINFVSGSFQTLSSRFETKSIRARARHIHSKSSAIMGEFVFNAVVLLSTYLMLLFATVALACALFYLAELAEVRIWILHSEPTTMSLTIQHDHRFFLLSAQEYCTLTKIILKWVFYVVAGLHVLLMTDDRLPTSYLFLSLLCNVCYASMLLSFPVVRLVGAPFISSICTMICVFTGLIPTLIVFLYVYLSFISTVALIVQHYVWFEYFQGYYYTSTEVTVHH